MEHFVEVIYLLLFFFSWKFVFSSSFCFRKSLLKKDKNGKVHKMLYYWEEENKKKKHDASTNGIFVMKLRCYFILALRSNCYAEESDAFFFKSISEAIEDIFYRIFKMIFFATYTYGKSDRQWFDFFSILFLM